MVYDLGRLPISKKHARYRLHLTGGNRCYLSWSFCFAFHVRAMRSSTSHKRTPSIHTPVCSHTVPRFWKLLFKIFFRCTEDTDPRVGEQRRLPTTGPKTCSSTTQSWMNPRAKRKQQRQPLPPLLHTKDSTSAHDYTWPASMYLARSQDASGALCSGLHGDVSLSQQVRRATEHI